MVRTWCIAAAMASAMAASSAVADETPSFKDKTIMVVVGAAAGGSTDAFGRLAGSYIADELPGKPTVVVRDQPGAGGVVALNSFYRTAKPDGLTIATGAGTQSDPLNYRTVNAVYDLTRLEYIGGLGRTGTVVVIRKDALPRLHDKTQPPVAMGALSAIRSGMQMTLWGTEYLGWNVRWVTGYPGNSDILLALQRREVDMTSLATIDEIETLMKTGEYATVTQSGALIDGRQVPQPAYGGAPLLGDLLAGKLVDPVAREAFDYWKNTTQVGQWLALPPDTPPAIVRAYRDAFQRALKNPEFIARLKRLNADIVEMSAAETAALVAQLAGTSDAALAYMQGLQRKQGVRTVE
ncbi:MAG: Bug family tripartite tricarboxylate transporter substrate binding protein [Gemmatimonas sp.]